MYYKNNTYYVLTPYYYHYSLLSLLIYMTPVKGIGGSWYCWRTALCNIQYSTVAGSLSLSVELAAGCRDIRHGENQPERATLRYTGGQRVTRVWPRHGRVQREVRRMSNVEED